MKKYSEKQIKLLETVCSIISSGISELDITVAGIAEAAGMGKSTVYEYFKSKDELIAEAVMYFAEKNTNMFMDAVPTGGTVRDRMNALLNCCLKMPFDPVVAERFLNYGQSIREILHEEYESGNIKDMFMPLLDKISGTSLTSHRIIITGAILTYLTWYTGVFSEANESEAREISLKMANAVEA